MDHVDAPRADERGIQPVEVVRRHEEHALLSGGDAVERVEKPRKRDEALAASILGRRVALHRETLRPQAESTFEAVLAGYVAGRGGVSDLLMAEQEALEVSLRELQARRDFAVAWSDLHALVGGPVTANEEPMAQRDEEATP